jgi:hypothetical protein
MLLRFRDLEDPLRMDDKADRQSDRTWKITAVAFEDLQDRKATSMARASHSVLKVWPNYVELTSRNCGMIVCG